MYYMPNRNLVLVVDDDPGMLKGVQRLLRQHAYEPILFSSAQAFKSHTDFDKAVCVILDINGRLLGMVKRGLQNRTAFTLQPLKHFVRSYFTYQYEQRCRPGLNGGAVSFIPLVVKADVSQVSAQGT